MWLIHTGPLAWLGAESRPQQQKEEDDRGSTQRVDPMRDEDDGADWWKSEE